MTDFDNTAIIEEFRANGGDVASRMPGEELLLLHHVGARSGTERVNPLAYLPAGEGYAIFASKGGAPQNPDWYHNLLANPYTTVEVGTETVKVKARVAEPAERDAIYARQVERAPQFGDHERNAAPYRTIPVVVPEPVK
ncbi:MAG: nitroreductase/quinone reductase family protein [Trebonia sp.]|jgi:deazaflavin-dependent oxidoreductase (nitroreductase family)